MICIVTGDSYRCIQIVTHSISVTLKFGQSLPKI